MYFMKDETFTKRDGGAFTITTFPKGLNPQQLSREGMSNSEIDALIYEKESRNVDMVLAVLNAYQQAPGQTFTQKQGFDWADLIDQLTDEEEVPPEDGYHRIPNKGYEILKLQAEWTIPNMPIGFVRVSRKLVALLTELPEEMPAKESGSPNGKVTPIGVGVE
tara:strand:- start:217 stop:705 length:489 start_codon:yes stop_codon:yes gene_type:complete